MPWSTRSSHSASIDDGLGLLLEDSPVLPWQSMLFGRWDVDVARQIIINLGRFVCDALSKSNARLVLLWWRILGVSGSRSLPLWLLLPGLRLVMRLRPSSFTSGRSVPSLKLHQDLQSDVVWACQREEELMSSVCGIGQSWT